jgi:hypothetical protein
MKIYKTRGDGIKRLVVKEINKLLVGNSLKKMT